MAKTSGEIEKEFINGLKTGTSKDLLQWMEEIKNSGIEKRNDIIKWLKEKYSFGHMNASLLTGIYINDGKPVYADEQILLDSQFAKSPEMRTLFDKLQRAVMQWDKGAVFVPKKTYISITKKREFAAVNIKKGEIRLGLDLGDMPYDNWIEKSKLTGPMPRISHMVTIKAEENLNKKLFQLLEKADKRVNP